MHVNCLSVGSSLTPVKSLWQARPGGSTRMSVRYASEFNKPLDTLPWPATPHVSNISRQRRSLSQFCVRRLNKRLRTLLPVSPSPPVCIGSRGTSGPGWCNACNVDPPTPGISLFGHPEYCSKPHQYSCLGNDRPLRKSLMLGLLFMGGAGQTGGTRRHTQMQQVYGVGLRQR